MKFCIADSFASALGKLVVSEQKAEIDKEAWDTLNRDKSRPFARPKTGRFAVKVINHFGDEVMKVFGV